MAFCTQCGSSVPEGTRFCTTCGASQVKAPAPAPQPASPCAPAPAQTLEEPISTGSYIGIFLLLMIPLVNLLCMLIWACGGCNKRNLTNLSRAMLVWMLISIVISTLLVMAGGVFFAPYIDEAKQALDELNKVAEGYQR